MVRREQASYNHLLCAISEAIRYTVGDPHGDPPHNSYLLGGSARIGAGSRLMVERKVLAQGSADKLAYYEGQRESAIAGMGSDVLTQDESDFFIAWAARLELLFWSLVPTEKLPKEMLDREGGSVSEMRTLTRRTILPLDTEEE